MANRPRLLDLFCGAGGCAMGYHRAGFDVVGVDLKEQPRYPFEFHRADALEFLVAHGSEFDAIHASPPCQRYSHATVNRDVGEYPDLVGPTRSALQAAGRPWVIENVERSPLESPVRLCALMFGLPMFRHRLFESSFLLLAPSHPRHRGTLLDGSIIGVYKGKWLAGGQGGVKGRLPLESRHVETWKRAMGIDWMNGHELTQAIPPAYTEFVGRQLLAVLEAR